MRQYYRKDYRARGPARPVYNLIVNPAAAGYSQKKIHYLTAALAKAKVEFHILNPTSPRDTVLQIRKIIHHRPTGLIVCGGDATVNLAAQTLIRHDTGLAIYPLGKINNIYRSLYGEPDPPSALAHILSHKYKLIDHGLVSGKFFLGSLGIGLIPELAENMQGRGMPRFSISWSRLAAQAAARVKPAALAVKMDAFRFEISPLMLNINLLPYSASLPLTPASLFDDGKGEIIFDMGKGSAIFSNYVRSIYRKKYIYSDEIRMFRGNKISITPMAGQKVYIDGEIIEHGANEMTVDIFEKKIKVFYKAEG